MKTNLKEYKRIKDEIEKIDGEINERVFEIYGLTKKEIKVVKKQ